MSRIQIILFSGGYVTSRCNLGLHPGTLLDNVEYPAALVQSNYIFPPRLLHTSDLQTRWAVGYNEGQGITYQTTYLLWVSLSKTSTRALFHGQIDTGGLRSTFSLETGGAASHPPEYARCMS